MACLLMCMLFFLFLRSFPCQPDCSGVDCPRLHSCIEEVLESGACCASCMQRGCTCEGYQYYDCINAGFKNGKVPEGDSYFVDYGSTECSCPEGGGRISCHFISCPDLPPNCIDFSEPADGCMQCERVGCIHGGEKYEAGYSFHFDPCQVCHCPNEGGKLICYPVPDCDPQTARKSMLATPTEEDTPSGHDTYPSSFDQQDHMDHLSRSGSLPLFKSSPLGEGELGDYDYGPTESPDSFLQSLVFPTEPSPSNKVISLSRGSDRTDRTTTLQSFDRRTNLELRERFEIPENPTDRVEETGSPMREEQRSVKPSTREDTSSQRETSPQSVSVSRISPQTDLENPVNANRSVIFPLHQGLGGEEHPHKSSKSPLNLHRSSTDMTETQSPSDSVTVPVQIYSHHPVRGTESQTNPQTSFPLYMSENSENPIPPQARPKGQRTMDSEERVDEEDEEDEERTASLQNVAGLDGTDEPYNVKSTQDSAVIDERMTTVESSTPFSRTTPTVHLNASLQPSARPPAEESRPKEDLLHTLFNLHSEDQTKVKEERTEPEEDRKDLPVFLVQPGGAPRVSAEDLQSCCAAGQKWATENQNCNNIPVHNEDKQSVCSVAQKQCCLSSLKESRCVSGMTWARGGRVCAVDEEDRCTDDSYQVCCSCCALGLRLRREGQGCDAHQYLGYLCGHIFLTCCEEEEGPSQFPLKRKQKPTPTAMPWKVSDSKFPKEAFSVGAADEAANAVEEGEDVDKCQLRPGQLCQHTCTNIWGSYRCGCHRGYTLQHDGHSCAPVSPEEDNRVRAEDSLPAQTTTPSTTSSSPAHLSPCTGNGPCSQRCAVVGGQTRCSCFPGFSLMSDGHTCKDVDECSTNTHSCGPGERCVNTVGSFVCELQVTCPAGRRLRNGVCEDVDECVQQSHDCGAGFVCENTVGSFLCHPKHKCLSGFTQDAHGNCIDINECSTLNDPCSSGFNCINTVGSYTCQRKTIMCNHGYHASRDGAECVDIDECQMGTHRCGGDQICHNLPGTYRCDCQTGYQYDALRKVCSDVNECWRSPGRLCAQTCENTPGSYRCSCTAGFSLAFDGKTCEDVNECDRSPCSQECVNVHGSYQCYCRQGFYLKEDGHTCEDIDECSHSVGNLCSFRCVNVAGSYRCVCPPHGYVTSANGRTCRDIDECTTGTHNCSYGQTCYNVQGGFRCLSFDCPHNYKKVSDTRCERLGCPSSSVNCQNSPVRITFYQLSFQTNIIIPAQIFRIGPSPAYAGDNIIISITKGNDEGYFSTRKLNSFTGAVYLQRHVPEPRDFLIDVEMKLLRQGTVSSFLARIYVFITSSAVM